jgi:hypothetical protein
MAKKSVTEKSKNRSGPRAPAGKKPLMVIIDEKTIKQAKIRAIEGDMKVSRVVEGLLRGWLSGEYELKS